MDMTKEEKWFRKPFGVTECVGNVLTVDIADYINLYL